MSKIFEGHQATLISKTLWLIPGRVLAGEIELGDVLRPESADTAEDQVPNCKVMAIETYGEAIDFLSEGITGELIVQVMHTEYDAFMRQLPAVFLLKAED